MKRSLIQFNYLLLLILFTVTQTIWGSPRRHGETLCMKEGFQCIKVKQGDSWNTLFPNPELRDMIRRANRMNIRLKVGMILAIPTHLERLTIFDLSPFPRYINPVGEKTIYISQKKLAWAAYEKSGELVWWGPISSGADSCPNVIGGCATPTGYYRLIRKQDIDCISTAFPRRTNGDNGGAEMPFCMHFFRGYALHGSEDVPGYRASHGCIRLFTEDARWLNEEFITVFEEDTVGTRLIVDTI